MIEKLGIHNDLITTLAVLTSLHIPLGALYQYAPLDETGDIYRIIEFSADHQN